MPLVQRSLRPFRPDLRRRQDRASWEAFGIGHVVDRLRAGWPECFFWRTHAGAELDLLVVRGRTRRGYEFKRTTAPSVTPSMRQALADLRLSPLDVVHAGANTFPLARGIRAVALSRLHQDVDPLRQAREAHSAG